ncbi:plasmid partitioning protein RepB [Acuticoccus kandeliae]|uniref:plasmid partitioning protein RepB n=1 Tax=Acuticoccus kandeliae TaxID=2073160 RepID=UPI000D3E2BF3|nr:plasmid partitioning protein RepB [Acuticoccus kandeliae]
MTKRRIAMERLLQVEEPEGTGPAPPMRAGAVRTMGLALHRMSEKRPREEAVEELDPALCDPSFVRDRLEDGADGAGESDASGIAALAASIAESGQAVPILVRPHPEAAGRYQIAYGHRRWLACRRLGRPVRALVHALDDEALVVAQGRENNDRRDLTFIERAHFAAALSERGMTRAVIGKALGVDKSELARLIAVAEGLPEGLAARIGRAPKAGRPRWLMLVERCRAGGREAARRAEKAAVAGAHLPTDERFKAVFEALAPAPASAAVEVAGSDLPVRIRAGRGTTVITIDEAEAPEFGRFVEEQLDALFRAYLKRKGEGGCIVPSD